VLDYDVLSRINNTALLILYYLCSAAILPRISIDLSSEVYSLRSTKFWVLTIMLILVAASVLSLLIMNANKLMPRHSTVIAKIYQNGECIHNIDLSAVVAEYTIQIGGEVTNTVSVKQGRICISDATCPDHVCVRQGWITNGIVPIVCLPNNVVIQIEGAPKTDIDAIVQ